MSAWLIVAVLLPALVVTGTVMASRKARRPRTALVAFTLAALIVAVRMGSWLAFETLPGVSSPARVIATLAVLGICGAWWMAAVTWARRP